MSLLFALKIFHPFSSVSIVNFEQVNCGWVFVKNNVSQNYLEILASDLKKEIFSLLGNFYLSILQNEQQKERKKYKQS